MQAEGSRGVLYISYQPRRCDKDGKKSAPVLAHPPSEGDSVEGEDWQRAFDTRGNFLLPSQT